MLTVAISRVAADDRDPFLAAVGRSQALHGDWASPPARPAEFDAYFDRMSRDDHVAFLARLEASNELVGVVNISNIIRGSFQSAFVGFYAFEPHANCGYMKLALRMVLARAFGELGLHRIEANIQPENAASIALVRACGFRREGFSPKYLKIAGEWRDHERWALLAEEFPLDARA